MSLENSRILCAGIFLHILADTLGSVGVIISSLLIHYFGWTASDAVCSIFISLLILLTVWGLLKDTGGILLQQTPTKKVAALRAELENVRSSCDCDARHCSFRVLYAVVDNRVGRLQRILQD